MQIILCYPSCVRAGDAPCSVVGICLLQGQDDDDDDDDVNDDDLTDNGYHYHHHHQH